MLKKTIMTTVLSLVLIVSALPTAASAAATLGSVEIVGTHRIDNNEALSSFSNTFVLTAENEAPMPSGSNGSTKEVTATANSGFSFGSIDYVRPGTYEYTVSRKAASIEGIEADASVYRVHVAVFSDGTDPAIIYTKEGVDGKEDRIEYVDHQVCKITYILNGGKIDGNEGPIVIEYSMNENITLLKAPVKDGYVFDYWKGSRYEAGAQYQVVGDHTFEAIYKGTASPAEKTDTDTPSKGKSSGIKTGDNNQLFMYAGLFVLAIFVLLVIFRKNSKSKGE